MAVPIFVAHFLIMWIGQQLLSNMRNPSKQRRVDSVPILIERAVQTEPILPREEQECSSEKPRTTAKVKMNRSDE
jgi:hypothetical protein